jgi:hypothetical protein
MSENRKFDNLMGGWQTHEAALDRAVGLYWTNRADAIEARKASEAKAREDEAGTPFKLTDKEAKRFEDKVIRGSGDNCDLWVAGKDGPGYGQFYLRGKQPGAHVVSWQNANGKLADPSRSMVIAHLCEVRDCVRPSHLDQQSQQQNVLYADSSIDAKNRAKTHCPRGHELTEENCKPDRWARDERCCRVCELARGGEKGARIKAAHEALGITQSEYVSLYGQGMAAATAIIADLGCELEHRKKQAE